MLKYLGAITVTVITLKYSKIINSW